MFQLSILAISLLASSAAAKLCQNVTIPVQISARQGVFNVPTLVGNLDATVFAQNLTSIRGNFSEESLTGYATIKGKYEISAKFCKPDMMFGKKPTVQVLTHGIGFDKTYIDVAVDKYGFCTLSIDRLGIGNSSIADPLQVIQAPAETSALYEVTVMLRNGTVPNIPQAFEKVVHVGHSFGSVLTYDLVAQYPRASDGIILTGYSQDGAFFFQTIADFNSKLARLNQPLRFGNISSTVVQQGLSMFIYPELDSIKNYLSKHQITITEVESVVQSTELGDLITGIYPTSLPQMQNLPTGYLTWSDAASNQYAFLYPGFFDPRILNFAESVKMPYTIGELLTIGSSPKSTDFKGPVQILTGNEDEIYCGGDCMNTGNPALGSIPAAAKASFPSAKTFQAYIQPNTGHGINFHYNSTGAFQVMQQFFVTQGLASS